MRGSTASGRYATRHILIIPPPSQPWITPILFDNTGNSAIVDEWTFGQLQSRATAQSVLTNHWNTWITEQDFIDIAAAGCVTWP